MDPVLIRTFPDRIAKEKALLASAVIAVQAIYTGLKAVNATATIAEITGLVNTYLSPAHRQTIPSGVPTSLQALAGIQPEPVVEKFPFLEEFVKEKLFPSVKASFNGAPLLDEKIREMIAVPDLTDVQTALKDYYQERSRSGADAYSTNLKAEQFKLVGDVVSKADNADSAIDAKHTHYTRNDRGVNITNNLVALCTALNGHKALIGNNLNEFDRGHTYPATALQGVERSEGGYIPSLDFIRRNENYQA